MQLSGWRRLSIALTAVWLLAMFALYEVGRIGGTPFPIGKFLLVGVLPPLILWASWWVWKGFNTR